MSGIRPCRRVHRERGAVAVEFALVLPILLLLIFGVMQYGLYFWSAQGGSTAVREAARRAAVGDLTACSAFEAQVRERIGGLGDAANADITRTFAKGPGNDRPEVQVGDTVSVSVSFHAPDLHLPLVPFVDDGLVVSTADARVENVGSPPEVCT